MGFQAGGERLGSDSDTAGIIATSDCELQPHMVCPVLPTP